MDWTKLVAAKQSDEAAFELLYDLLSIQNIDDEYSISRNSTARCVL